MSQRSRIVEKAIAPRHNAKSEPRVKFAGLVCEYCAVEGTLREGTTYFAGHVCCDDHESTMQKMANEVTDMAKLKDEEDET
jgi:O-succinylbenzoate synthase